MHYVGIPLWPKIERFKTLSRVQQNPIRRPIRFGGFLHWKPVSAELGTRTLLLLRGALAPVDDKMSTTRLHRQKI